MTPPTDGIAEDVEGMAIEPAVAGRRRLVRTGCWILVLLPVALFLALQVGFHPGERFIVRRGDGSPVEGATVAFHYYGHRFNLVDSITYERSGGVRRSDALGRVTIPPRVYLKVHWIPTWRLGSICSTLQSSTSPAA